MSQLVGHRFVQLAGMKYTDQDGRECGVVVPVESSGQDGGGGDDGLGAFAGSVPVPMEVPGRAFVGGEGGGSVAARTPWFNPGI